MVVKEYRRFFIDKEQLQLKCEWTGQKTLTPARKGINYYLFYFKSCDNDVAFVS